LVESSGAVKPDFGMTFTFKLSDAQKLLLPAIIVGGCVMGVSLGIRGVQGLFLIPATLDRGWLRQDFALALGIQNLVWGATQPFIGALADRFGAVRIVVGGILLYVIGLVGLAWATSVTHLMVSVGFSMGIALSCTAFGTVYAAIGKIAPLEQRAWALSLAGAIGGLGQFILVPLIPPMQLGLGWEKTLLVLAGVALLLVPLVRKLDDRSQRAALYPAVASADFAHAVRSATRSRDYWLLTAGFTACGFQLSFISYHLPAYLLEKGIAPTHAAVALGLIALANIPGTFVLGNLGGRWPRKYVLAALYLARSAAMLAFLAVPTMPLTVYVFSALMGFLWLGTVPLTTGIIAGSFGVRYLATLFGLVFLGHQLGGFFGAWLGGYIYEIHRSYDLVWLIAIGSGLLGAALHLPIRYSPPELGRMHAS
jgi:MFS family permease